MEKEATLYENKVNSVGKGEILIESPNWSFKKWAVYGIKSSRMRAGEGTMLKKGFSIKYEVPRDKCNNTNNKEINHMTYLTGIKEDLNKWRGYYAHR